MLVVFTISGFAAIALEVVWFRILVLYLDSNTYAFTIMLATVLAGIALGSYLAAPLMRWAHRSLVPLAIAELAVALAALLSVYLLSQTSTSPTTSAVLWARRTRRAFVSC